MCPLQTDILVIGCGIAGASAALRLAQDSQRQITVITRATEAEESNSRYAQGGIVTLGEDDSVDILVKDILAAGAGLSLSSAARIVAEEGPGLVREVLIEQAGVVFDQSPDGQLIFGREAAHSRPRILHVGDATGKAIIRALIEVLQRQPNVRIVTSATAVDLITFPHHLPGRGDHPRHRRTGPHLSPHDQSAWVQGRRAGDGLPRWSAGHQRRVRPVSPHSPRCGGW